MSVIGAAEPARSPLATLLPEEVIRRCTRTRFKRDDCLCRQGEEASDVLLVEQGQVRVVVTDPSGKQLLLALRGAGDLLGELSVIDGAPRSADVIAMGDVTAIRIPANEFRAVVTRTPRFAVALLQMVTRRLRETDQRLLEQVIQTTQIRLARRLLELAAQHVRYEDAVRLTIPISQEQLAGLIGATRESTSKALSDLRAHGIVDTGRGSVTILDLDALLDQAQL